MQNPNTTYEDGYVKTTINLRKSMYREIRKFFKKLLTHQEVIGNMKHVSLIFVKSRRTTRA